MKKAVLCIDIETGGCQPSKHPLIAIGTCLRHPDGKKEKKIWVFQFDEKDFEERCVVEFWSKNRDKLEKLGSFPKSGISDFAAYIDSIDEQYPDLILMSDNPQYDIGFINYHYDVYLDRKPLSYKKTGQYRVIVDQNSYLWAMLPEEDDPWVWDSKVLEKYKFKVDSVHSHLPHEDAEHILDIFIGVYESK